MTGRRLVTGYFFGRGVGLLCHLVTLLAGIDCAERTRSSR